MPDEPSPRMAVVEGIEGLEWSLGRLFIVIGVFDGLHRGHAYLLDELQRAAKLHDALPAVITFDHHPDEILTGAAPPLLCDPDERLARLESAGVAVTVVQHFDRALRETPYDAFVRRIAARVELCGFLMTPDSAFGYERAGTPETIAALGRELGYHVLVVPQFTLEGESVSSSKIRAAIAAGNLRAAERLLGRPYAAVGRGSRIQRDPVLTFETPVTLPPKGWYAARIDDLDEGTTHGPDHVRVLDASTVRLTGVWLGGPRWRVTFDSKVGE